MHSMPSKLLLIISINLSGYNQCSCNKQKSDFSNKSFTVTYLVGPKLLQLYDDRVIFLFLFAMVLPVICYGTFTP